jgi:hypothetical protein
MICKYKIRIFAVNGQSANIKPKAPVKGLGGTVA